MPSTLRFGQMCLVDNLPDYADCGGELDTIAKKKFENHLPLNIYLAFCTGSKKGNSYLQI